MSQIPETADLEAQIEALIKRAGESLRQQLDNVHRDPTARGPDGASRSSTSSTADSHPGNADSRTESAR
jgi:hypothetical protein